MKSDFVLGVPPDLSFSKSRRLIRTAEFEWVRREGRTHRGSLVTLAVANAPAAEEIISARIGIIVSRKVGGAVARNRVRRRVREIFRKHQPELSRGIWLVVIVSPRAVGASYSQLEDEWLRLAGRASIIAP
jgi:ribonuclease P protein component